MGKFRDYLTENRFDVGQSMHAFVNDRSLSARISDAMKNASFKDFDVPKQLDIPHVQREGEITHMLTSQNPIYVRLSDGTECNFSYDQFRRIDGTPALGKRMSIVFVRHPEDGSSLRSVIRSARVLD